MALERPTPELGTQDEVLGKRVVAFIVDAILVLVVSSVVTAPLTALSPRLVPLASSVTLVIGFVYFTYLEARSGQTLGKKLMDIVVVTEDGEPIDVGASAIRNVLRIVDNFPFFYILGLVVIAVSDDDQRVGDLAADTLVVRVRKGGPRDGAAPTADGADDEGTVAAGSE